MAKFGQRLFRGARHDQADFRGGRIGDIAFGAEIGRAHV
mgnify:CR=1 FL=1